MVPSGGAPEATQAIRPGGAPEATQVVRPGTAPSQPFQPATPQFPQSQAFQPAASAFPPGPAQPQAFQPAAQPFHPGAAPPQPFHPPQPFQPGAPQPQLFSPQPFQQPFPPQFPHGRPGYPPMAQFASWGSRALAGFVDYGVIAALTAVATFSDLMLLLVVELVALVNVFYNVAYLGGQGQTLGKKVAGIKLVREDTGQPVGFGLALGRAFLHIVDALPVFVGFFAPLWDEKRRTFSDKIVNTVVVMAGPPAPAQPSQYGQPPRQW